MLLSSAARAGEETRVVSGTRGPGQLFDFNLSLGWTHDDKRADLKRQSEGTAGGGRILLQNDLVYRQTRDTLNMRADVGVFQDVSVFASLPLVIADNRQLDFAKGIDERNTTILRDGILPGFGTPMFGLDATHARSFVNPSDTVFRGPTRKGLEYLGLGVSWAVLNELRDDTRPTWLLRLETRWSVGTPMKFDPARGKANTGVATGYHQFVLSTAFSRRFEMLEPYVGGWYMLPLATDDSAYEQYKLGERSYSQPQQRAGTNFGVDVVAWEEPRAQRRINIELRGRMELRFMGLAQSELWEPLSGNPECAKVASACRPDVDRDLTGDLTADPNPGVTRSPAYGVFGGDAGLSVQVGRYVRFRGLVGMTWEQSHFLTDGRSDNEAYDIPGRRYRVEGSRAWHVSLEGGLLF